MCPWWSLKLYMIVVAFGNSTWLLDSVSFLIGAKCLISIWIYDIRKIYIIGPFVI